MAEALKVSDEKYRRILSEYDPVFAIRLEIFSEISFPSGIGNNCFCIYLSGISQTLQFSKLGLTWFFGVVTSFADIFPRSVLE